MAMEANLPATPAVSFSLVFSQYELSRRIFMYLPIQDLRRCAQVSRDMNQVAMITLSDPVRHRSPLVLSWRGPIVSPSTLLKAPLFQSPDHQDMYNEVRTWTQTIHTEPKVCIAFHSGDFFQIQDDDVTTSANVTFDKAFKSQFFVDFDRVDKLLPAHCRSVSMMAPGIVLMDPFSRKPLEIENVDKQTPALSMVAFPDLSKCQIVPFNVSEDFQAIKEELCGPTVRVTPSEIAEMSLKKITQGQIDDLSTIKGLILLSDGHAIPHSIELIREIAKQTQGRFALGGGLGHLARCSSEEATQDLAALFQSRRWDFVSPGKITQRTSGLLFAGPNVNVASKILNQSMRTEKKVRTALSEFKASGLNLANAVGFMFACTGRGRGFHRGKKNMESGIFNELYPSVPLIGIFGNGEIGIDFCSSTHVEPTVPISQSKCVLSYTSVFLVVSFDN
ncbi:F-box only protein 22-like [Tigriopus californicus]|uniref:F-box only protein 22-like n=1 Tax=Tigriopus californicus TaxID=6832 RepID=UPI0027DA776A|nr:F-box only protein 22-like [Tigriopus californicus]